MEEIKEPTVSENTRIITKVSSRPNTDIISNLQPFNFNGNLAENWKLWFQKFEIYLLASNLDEESDNRKIALLLHHLGDKCLDIFNSFNLSDADKKSYQTVISKFEAYFIPRKNLTVLRHKFLNRKQGPTETIDNFYTDLVNLSLACEFKEIRESIVCDVLISGLNNSNQHIKERLLRESDLSLEKAIAICKAAELSQIQVKELETDRSVCVLNRNRGHQPSNYQNTNRPNNNSKQKSNNQTSKTQGNVKRNNQNQPMKQKMIMNCNNCGKNHPINKCAAYNVTCFKCGKRNHFSSVCKSKRVFSVQMVDNTSENIGQLSLNDQFVDSGPTSSFSIDIVNSDTVNNRPSPIQSVPINVSNVNDDNSKSNEWFENLSIRGHTVSFKLDTGAQTNILSICTFDKIGLSKSLIKPTYVSLSSLTGEKIPVLGTCDLDCIVNKKMYCIMFVIVAIDCSAILGLSTCCRLNFIQRNVKERLLSNPCSVNSLVLSKANSNVVSYDVNDILNQYPSLFDGKIGQIPTLVHLSLVENAKPIIEPPRRVPFSMLEPLKKELQNMEANGIIVKETEPTEWVNSMVIINKRNSGLKVVLDPRNLNKYIKRPHCQMPTIDELTVKFTGAKLFSTLDASSAFWMLKLDDESSKLCCFNTPFGRYRYLRLPYGISSAPDIFHYTVSQIFHDIEGVSTYIDDICVSGKNKIEHDDRLLQVLKRAHNYGIKFNINKCKFAAQEVLYLGHKFSSEGLSPDPSKIIAIQEMPRPKNQKELQRFLGVVNYVSKFIQNFSSLTAPLRAMLRKNVDFQWQNEQEQSFLKLKSMLVSPPVLTYYDQSKELTMSVDSSCSGLGAVLLSEGKPIAYASRALTASQCNYCQIEKEMLAIVFGCTRFHQYIFNRKVNVESDHKPLECLFKKPIAAAPLRLQRMMLKVQRYDLNVTYKPGKELLIADTLSRAYLPVNVKEEIDFLDEDIICEINMFKSSLPISESKLKLFQQETNKDVCLQSVKNYLICGWPTNQFEDKSVLPFWNVRYDLHVIDGLIFKNNSLVVPKELQQSMLEKLHNGHVGKQTCLLRARNLLYWPTMQNDIQFMIDNCKACSKYKPMNCKEPLIFHDIPKLPWNKVCGDIFEFDNIHYLVIMDYYSKYLELVTLPSLTSNTVIEKCKSFFARHGIPLTFVADAGTQFTSKSFSDFAISYDFKVVIVSAKHSQSNGQAESGVKIAKNILRKAKETNTDIYLCLLDYRNTPKPYQPSPAEMMFSRKLNSLLPISSKDLKPKICNPSSTVLKKRKETIKKYYDKHTRELSDLNVGDKVNFKKTLNHCWTPGKIISKNSIPRSYVLVDDNNTKFIRNRKFIRSNLEQSEDELQGSSTMNESTEPSSTLQDKFVSTNQNSHTEESVLKNFNNYVTGKGRIVRNPKRLTYE